MADSPGNGNGPQASTGAPSSPSSHRTSKLPRPGQGRRGIGGRGTDQDVGHPQQPSISVAGSRPSPGNGASDQAEPEKLPRLVKRKTSKLALAIPSGQAEERAVLDKSPKTLDKSPKTPDNTAAHRTSKIPGAPPTPASYRASPNFASTASIYSTVGPSHPVTLKGATAHPPKQFSEEPSSPETQLEPNTPKFAVKASSRRVYKKKSRSKFDDLAEDMSDDAHSQTDATPRRRSILSSARNGSSPGTWRGEELPTGQSKPGPQTTGPAGFGSKDELSDESYPDLDDMALEDRQLAPTREHQPGVGGLRWAPYNIPAKRRLQTLVIMAHSLSIIGLVSFFFACCAIPLLWPLVLVYLIHVLTSRAAHDGALQYRYEWVRGLYIWRLFADYFPARLHKTHDLAPTRKYILGYHPHGIISHGAWAAFATDALGFSTKFPGITNSLLTLDSNFRIPVYRDYILGMGVRSVSKESIINILSRGGSNGEGMGRAVTIVIGGARESLEAQPGRMRLILKQRKGFIKIAARTGADIVPVLAFGENELYDQLTPGEHPFVHKVQMFVLKVWKFTLPFLHGRGIFNYDVGLMPYRRPLNIVVGAPIKVTQTKQDPAQDEVDRLHGLYVAELQKLWDRYKDDFAPNRKEEIQILA